MSVHRALRALLAMVLGAAAIGVLLSSPPASAAPGDAAPSDSRVTTFGAGAFAGLDVTVSQTKNLINQTITVSWTGGPPTLPTINFAVNYLQIMQCWGDDPEGPDRTQCQYGVVQSTTPSAGTFVRSRQINYGITLVDRKETLKPSAGSLNAAFVPFWPVGQPKPIGTDEGGSNEFFDPQVTNEIPLARTRGDGTGLEFFEVQTVRQAAGLGCGAPVTAAGATKGRSCWLVIVPRGNTEVDGSTRTVAGNGLDSSPLSQTNWENRIVFPLEFQPVGQACPIGASERRVIGHELAADAFSSWQPALCAGGGALFSYSQLTDDVTRNVALDGSSPGLALTTNPIPPDQAPPDRPLLYAPVALSGLAIAFNVEHSPAFSVPPDERHLAGQRFMSMKLTPRLVAKLLTQSYQLAVQVPPEKIRNNPLALTVDPEFLELNPEYRNFTDVNKPPDALVQLDGSDVTSLLWSWVKADPDASAFLAGTPDNNKMVVNPLNGELTLPTSTFPRNDQSCVEVLDQGVGPLLKHCTSDAHPFTKDMHDAGLSASRGDTQARQTVAEQGLPVPKKVARQNPGSRALLAVVDAATASLYGLPTAALRNAAGQFVAPTTASLLAGAAAMKPSAVPSVRVSDPGAADPAAYPLTALSYAVSSPSTLDAAAGKDYAAFLRYAAGPGQRPGLAPGQLPFGLVPLPDTFRAQTVAAAAIVEALGKTAPGAPAPQPTSAGVLPGTVTPGAADSTAGQGTAGTGGTAAGSTGGAGAPPAGVAAQATGGAAAKVPGKAQQPVASVRRTPSLPAPAVVGGLFVTILLCAALAAMSPPVMHLLRTSAPVTYLLDAAVRRRARKGVTPTER